MADTMKIDFTIWSVDHLRIAKDPDEQQGLGAVIETTVDGETVRIGLSREALQTVYAALVDNPPPPTATLPRH